MTVFAIRVRRVLYSVAVAALALGLTACSIGDRPGRSALDDTAVMPMARLPAGEFTYYPPGEYLRGGRPVEPDMRTIRFEQDVLISVRQVSQAEYAACVRAGACKPLDRTRQQDSSPDLPATGVSWHDASAYAAWLSASTGQTYRLPRYEEWVYAAGSAYREDAILQEFDAANPAQRWLAEYALETQRKAVVDGALRPFGGFGANEWGVQDMAGNVWDWTDSCHVRQHIDVQGMPLGGENCGIRVVAGAHRSYIPDFIRDPKGGACSVGVPPSNLGFRLVREAAG